MRNGINSYSKVNIEESLVTRSMKAHCTNSFLKTRHADYGVAFSILLLSLLKHKINNNFEI